MAFVPTVGIYLKIERNLSGVRAVKLLVIAVWTARENTGIFTGSPAPLWPRGRPQDCEKTCIFLPLESNFGSGFYFLHTVLWLFAVTLYIVIF